jgi:hypothetical protein
MDGETNPTKEIGVAAGELYRYLYENGQVSLTKLRKDLPLATGRLDQALGWLARENKLDFTREKRTMLVALKQK